MIDLTTIPAHRLVLLLVDLILFIVLIAVATSKPKTVPSAPRGPYQPYPPGAAPGVPLGARKPTRGRCTRCRSDLLIFNDDGTGRCRNCGRTFRWSKGPAAVGTAPQPQPAKPVEEKKPEIEKIKLRCPKCNQMFETEKKDTIECPHCGVKGCM